MQRPSYQDDMSFRTQMIVHCNLGESQISGLAHGCKCHSSRKAGIQRSQSSLGTSYVRSTVSRRNCYFNTRHALPLTFIRFLRPRISRGNHAKCPRRGLSAALDHGPIHVLDLGLSHPHPQTQQSFVRSAHTNWSEKRPYPRSVRVHGLFLATNRRETGNLLAQSSVSSRTRTGPGWTGALEQWRPTSEIVQATFCPRSRQSSHKEANAYVLI